MKNLLLEHFRIILLFGMLCIIVVLTLNAKDTSDVLHFSTYSFVIEGTGELGDVDVEFDFQKHAYQLSTSLQPGNYSVSSSMGLVAFVEGVPQCGEAYSEDCGFEVLERGEVLVKFDGRGVVPNGRFMFGLFNMTEMELYMNMGENYSFVAVYSVHPKEMHGHYLPQENVFMVQTYDLGAEDFKAEYLDFDLYALNATSKKVDDANEWQRDFVTVPLIVSFLILFLSDLIDYVHARVKPKKGK